MPGIPVEYLITQYDLEQGALEIQYIEEYFGEFPSKKTATEIVRRLRDRTHLILIASGPAPDDPGMIVPVSYKVAHEICVEEMEPKLIELVHRLQGHVQFDGRRVLYTWIGGTRRDWRGQGHFRALTEQQATDCADLLEAAKIAPLSFRCPFYNIGDGRRKLSTDRETLQQSRQHKQQRRCNPDRCI